MPEHRPSVKPRTLTTRNALLATFEHVRAQSEALSLPLAPSPAAYTV